MFEDMEVVEFYEENTKKKDKIGTLHVYLPNIELDIRGIDVLKRGKMMFFNLPHRNAWDSEAEMRVGYPIISFCNPEKSKQFKVTLRQKALEFMKNHDWTKAQMKYKFVQKEKKVFEKKIYDDKFIDSGKFSTKNMPK